MRNLTPLSPPISHLPKVTAPPKLGDSYDLDSRVAKNEMNLGRGYGESFILSVDKVNVVFEASATSEAMRERWLYSEG